MFLSLFLFIFPYLSFYFYFLWGWLGEEVVLGVGGGGESGRWGNTTCAFPFLTKIGKKLPTIVCVSLPFFYTLKTLTKNENSTNPILLWLIANTLKRAPWDPCHCSHFSVKFSFYPMHQCYQCFCYNSWKLILQMCTLLWEMSRNIITGESLNRK